MKIVYRNVSQVIETLAWQKKTKSLGSYRSAVIGPCSDYATKTQITARIKILSNSSDLTTCSVYLAAGDAGDPDNAVAFYVGPQTGMDLTVGAVTTLSGTFTIRPTDLENNRELKIGTTASTPSARTKLASYVSWEVEYMFS